MMDTNAGTTPPVLRRFLRRREVCSVTGLPTSSLYQLMARGEFPKPFNISPNRVVWLEEEVAAWQAERLAARAKPKS